MAHDDDGLGFRQVADVATNHCKIRLCLPRIDLLLQARCRYR